MALLDSGVNSGPRGESGGLTRLTSYGVKITCLIFKTKMLVYHSKAKLDEIILWAKIGRF